jgi:hypothetical protein
MICPAMRYSPNYFCFQLLRAVSGRNDSADEPTPVLVVKDRFNAGAMRSSLPFTTYDSVFWYVKKRLNSSVLLSLLTRINICSPSTGSPGDMLKPSSSGLK